MISEKKRRDVPWNVPRGLGLQIPFSFGERKPNPYDKILQHKRGLLYLLFNSLAIAKKYKSYRKLAMSKLLIYYHSETGIIIQGKLKIIKKNFIS